MDTITIMYRVIEIMAKMRLPVVFKGAMVLKHVMIVNGLTTTYRLTGDIDMDWVEYKITTEELTNKIRTVVNGLGIEGLKVICRREADANRSAGFVVNYQGRKLFSFDISMKMNPFAIDYVTDTGVIFTGASIEKMYADKICVISSKLLFRRVKDIYDLYLLSYLQGYKIKRIVKICEYQKKDIQSFEEFTKRIQDLVHAYEKLDNIVNKPVFEVVYSRVRDFCLPFITGDYKYCNGSWNPNTGMWYQI